MQNYQKSILKIGSITLLGLIVLGLLTWGNYRYCEQNPGGNDFLVHWVGTRSFLIDGFSPYSDTVALRIQEIVYGRAAQAGEHELRVAYPLYSTMLFAPFAMISDFATARAVWMTVLEVSLALMAFLSIRVVNWKPGLGMVTVFLLFAFLWYHSIRPLILGNAVILVSLGVIVALLAIRSGRDELAGFILGLTTIKPQVVLLIILFVLFWGFSQRRWKLVGWLVGTVVVLSLGAMIFIPDWIIQNLWEIIRYPSYNPPGTPAAIFAEWWPGVGRELGRGLSIIICVLLILEWFAARNGEFRHLLWTACLTLAAGQWSGLMNDPGNFIMLFLPLTLVFAMWDERWRRSGKVLSIISMLLLFFGLWILFLATVEQSYQPIQSPLMFFPLPIFAIFCLYWVRWWAIKPRALWIDLLREREASS